MRNTEWWVHDRDSKIKQETLETRQQDSDLVLLLTGYETLDKSLPHPRLRFSTCKVGTTEQT